MKRYTNIKNRINGTSKFNMNVNDEFKQYKIDWRDMKKETVIWFGTVINAMKVMNYNVLK